MSLMFWAITGTLITLPGVPETELIERVVAWALALMFIPKKTSRIKNGLINVFMTVFFFRTLCYSET